MYYLYILLSGKDGKLYIGFASNLALRLGRHCQGLVSATKYRLPLRLIYYEVYRCSGDAKRREKFLKGGKGHTELKIQLKDTLRELGYKYQ